MPEVEETTVMSLARPSCAQRGQVEHTVAVGHEFSVAALSYASAERSDARSPSVGEKTATVLGLWGAKVKAAEKEIVLLCATSLALR
jgi:hypothetical protein